MKIIIGNTSLQHSTLLFTKQLFSVTSHFSKKLDTTLSKWLFYIHLYLNTNTIPTLFPPVV